MNILGEVARNVDSTGALEGWEARDIKNGAVVGDQETASNSLQ